MSRLTALVLAAGEGKRMRSGIPKVLHEIWGKTMVQYILDALKDITDEKPVVVVGHKAEMVKERLGQQVVYAYQQRQLGTAHAVKCAREHLSRTDGYVIILAGDIPLITADTLRQMAGECMDNGYSAVVLTAEIDDPGGYGRIVRDDDGQLREIIEDKDADQRQKAIKEINSGIYCFNIRDLLDGLDKISSNNVQGEYYLTDIIKILREKGLKVKAYKTGDATEIMGVNDRVQLARAAEVLRERIMVGLMLQGVTIIDPCNTYIDSTVAIGRDTIVYPGNTIQGQTTIGQGCIIYPNSRIADSHIGNNVKIQASVILESKVEDDTTVGPFAYLRPNSRIGQGVRIGDFVEVKNSSIGNGSKVSHLSYIGDAEIGSGVNVGCGVVVVNYDGKAKHKTTVRDKAFIGCNVNLIAPVEIKEGAYIAAGSTITHDVPEYSLAIARSRQSIKPEWVKKKMKNK
ncbi:MAG TPA: bifunctional UDP-N-acetylglucosamine diphosphorylase/glucosamine-1-phosphate N-acetyltransferase GlmU [Clostridiales bacterium]|nr:bifunctional UDP-N-acetylglucosamine diphosphorylase/glucosamine-1-phosphate N-acetyltransferase GlmU [Clostridiales bacterium]